MFMFYSFVFQWLKWLINAFLNQVSTFTSMVKKQNLGKVTRIPSVIAVSKTKSFELVAEAYDCGQRDFGENYVQELVQKSSQFKEAEKFDDIRWHFIGKLQSNKVKQLLSVANLECVQTVDSIKLANALNNTLSRLEDNEHKRLNVYVQINSSGEENKSGCKPEDCITLARHILNECPRLQFQGLMTIGSFSHDYAKGPNPDFQCMAKWQGNMCKELQMRAEDVSLSMGMSADYEHAILAGSTVVRIGSKIFGEKEYKTK